MFLKIFLTVLFAVLLVFALIRYSHSTKEAQQLSKDYVETGLRLEKDSRDMVKQSKDMVKKREKMAYDEQ